MLNMFEITFNILDFYTVLIYIFSYISNNVGLGFEFYNTYFIILFIIKKKNNQFLYFYKNAVLVKESFYEHFHNCYMYEVIILFSSNLSDDRHYAYMYMPIFISQLFKR